MATNNSNSQATETVYQSTSELLGDGICTFAQIEELVAGWDKQGWTFEVIKDGNEVEVWAERDDDCFDSKPSQYTDWQETSDGVFYIVVANEVVRPEFDAQKAIDALLVLHDLEQNSRFQSEDAALEQVKMNAWMAAKAVGADPKQSDVNIDNYLQYARELSAQGYKIFMGEKKAFGLVHEPHKNAIATFLLFRGYVAGIEQYVLVSLLKN